jgi:CRP/FNR family transcriptional regulator
MKYSTTAFLAEPKHTSASHLGACSCRKNLHLAAFEMLCAKHHRHRSIDPSQSLFFEGDRAQRVFVVTAGCIKIYKMLPDGRRQITGFAFRDDLLGLPIRDGYYAFTAEAVTAARVVSVTYERFENWLANSPGIALQLVKFVSDELAFAHEQLLLLGRKDAVERVASFLLMLLRRQHADNVLASPIHLTMSQIDIADFLGIRHETVSRALAVLRRMGVVSFVTSDQVLVKDRVRLIEIAGADDQPESLGTRSSATTPH